MIFLEVLAFFFAYYSVVTCVLMLLIGVHKWQAKWIVTAFFFVWPLALVHGYYTQWKEGQQ